MSVPKLRVFVIDDHPVVREAFTRLVREQEDMELAGEAATAAELLRRNFLRSMFNEFLGSGIAMKLANKPREAK